MKKIGFATTNKVFAQSLATSVEKNPALGFVPYLLLNPNQAAIDAEALGIDVAVVDVISGITDAEQILSFCRKLRQTVPGCRLMLLVSQNDKAGCELAIKATKNSNADDYIFYDASLQYLFAKLSAF